MALPLVAVIAGELAAGVAAQAVWTAGEYAVEFLGDLLDIDQQDNVFLSDQQQITIDSINIPAGAMSVTLDESTTLLLEQMLKQQQALINYHEITTE